jgi:hypothetical protein
MELYRRLDHAELSRDLRVHQARDNEHHHLLLSCGQVVHASFYSLCLLLGFSALIVPFQATITASSSSFAKRLE